MHPLYSSQGRGTLTGQDAPVLSVAFYYEAFQSGTLLEIRGKIISDDYRTLVSWLQNPTKLTLTTDTFLLELYLSDDEGHFVVTEGPTPKSL
jgi:hypothetical protein